MQKVVFMKILKFLLAIVLIYGAVQVGQYIYKMPKFSEGEVAADFTIRDDLKLSDLKGNYVVLDFWGSWCGPCIGEFPKLKQLYANYNGKQFTDASNFEIVGVAVETNERRWRAALERFNLVWPHQTMDKATSLRFFDSPIAASYGVKEVPTKFLIDPEGNIIAVNPPFEEIEKLLSSKLK